VVHKVSADMPVRCVGYVLNSSGYSEVANGTYPRYYPPSNPRARVVTRITTINVSDGRAGSVNELRCLQCPIDTPCVSVSDGLDVCEFYVCYGGIEYCTLNGEE
jgi:hypothetical protein